MATQSPAITAAVNAALGAVVDTAAKNTNNIPSKSVDDALPELGKAIDKAIAADPVVQNATNTEAHFWQKRTFWSWLAATAGGSAAALGIIIDYLQTHTFLKGDGSINWIVIGFALWSGRAAYRAGVATTPLGTPKVNQLPPSLRDR